MRLGINCLEGSAWYEWQLAGRHWRAEHPAATLRQAKRAADFFAMLATGENCQNARRRAFLETARDPAAV
jgi:hypothetical protein